LSDLRVMIVDDSAMYRRLLTIAMEKVESAKVVGTAPTGSLALQKLDSLAPNVVLLDIEMPEMNGIQVLESIKAKNKQIAVILISGTNSRSADIVMEGLSKGAVDFIPKPEGSDAEKNALNLSRQLAGVMQVIQTQTYARQARGDTAPSLPSVPRVQPAPYKPPSIKPVKIEIVVIGISTGGPRALEQMIPTLPATLRVPVVIVQHMPPIFTASLAKQLDKNSRIHVVESADGMVLTKGTVYIAPGGVHTMVVRQGEDFVIKLNDGPPVNSCKPAVDVLFRSVADVFNGRILSVVMTGMGQDGLYGAEVIKEKGGYCITQSEDTCVVYGMPQAVDKANLSDEKVPLEILGQRIAALIN